MIRSTVLIKIVNQIKLRVSVEQKSSMGLHQIVHVDLQKQQEKMIICLFTQIDKQIEDTFQEIEEMVELLMMNQKEMKMAH